MAEEIQILPAPPVRNRLHHLAGLAILAANFVRHRIRGYRTPRPTPLTDPDAAYRYSDAVVTNWLSHLERYLRHPLELAGKSALELGPGPDLGTGLVLLGKGLSCYRAIDAHPLLARSPEKLHLGLAERAARDTSMPLAQLTDALKRGMEGPLGYVHDPKLGLEVFGEASFDLILSHAVFEHLDRVKSVIVGLSQVARPGALLVAEIDLQTHTRWIREVDPLNIYRYTRATYRSLRFSGIPNRVRPDDYMELLTRNGWKEVRFFPRRVLPPEYIERVEPTLAKRFRGDFEHLGWLSVVLCARYGGGNGDV